LFPASGCLGFLHASSDSILLRIHGEEGDGWNKKGLLGLSVQAAVVLMLGKNSFDIVVLLVRGGLLMNFR